MVTDELVTRGNPEVVTSVANSGARFSERGSDYMVEQAESDSILAERLGLRHGAVPPHVFEQLVAKASDEVRKRLLRERPDMVKPIRSVVANVAGEMQLPDSVRPRRALPPPSRP